MTPIQIYVDYLKKLHGLDITESLLCADELYFEKADGQLLI